MRVLIITRNFPPEHGGIQRLMLHAVREFAKEFEIAVIAPAGSAALIPQIPTTEVSARPLARFFCQTLARAVPVAWRFKPDVVFAGSGLTAPFAWVAAKLVHARMVVYVHGLDLIVDHPLYRWLWRPFIRRADLCLANSRNTLRLAVAAGVDASRTAIVHPGAEESLESSGTSAEFRARFALGEGPLLLSIGRLIARKGLLEFVENVLPTVVPCFPNARLVVLGDEEPDLLQGNSAGLGARIRARAAELGIADNVRFIGAQSDHILSAAYWAADAHVFPVREVAGDVEGFGIVAVEAAAHGLPTVAFDVGGVADAVRDGVSGYTVPAGDYALFATRLIDVLRHPDAEALRRQARDFAATFSWNSFGAQIREHVKNLARAAVR